MMSFLVHTRFTTPDIPDAELLDLGEAEQRASLQLQRDGLLVGLWRAPGQRASWSLWNVQSAEVLHERISALPYWPWMTTEVHALARHPYASSLEVRPKSV